MLISIAVPSFQQGRFLDACLSSVARQTHRDIEVLIADGGSKDESLAVIERYTSSDPRFRLISTHDRGQADAIVKAFGAARGEVLCWLNSDDCFIDDKALERAHTALSGGDAPDVVSFGGVYLDAEGRPTRRIRLRYHPFDSLDNMPWRPAVIQPATFWRRRVYDSIGLRTDLHYVFDAVFFFFAHRDFRWVESDAPVAGYRLHGENKSATVRPARIRELAELERIKFGPRSMRSAYLDSIASLAGALDGVPHLGAPLKRTLYVAVNCTAFITFYRLPGI